jgi:hypothetical protein
MNDMSGECDKCGEHALECECLHREIGFELLNIISEKFLIDRDPVFDPKTGEIYRKTQWISKEEVKKMFPDQ